MGVGEVSVADLPTVNAALNACCTLLLVLGYGAIRQRWVQLHKTCMLSALVVSTAFLASYLYYHIVVRGGESTHFSGPEGVRIVYLVILVSHIVLAAVTVPLAMFTAWQGLRGRLDRHVRIARWTLPIWLYVSITGVVVYWMLYRLYPPGAELTIMSGD
jgi:putative membrane protein